MNKVCLITHLADQDGAVPIILARYVFENVDIFSCEVNEVEDVFNSIMEKYNAYDQIYVVDLNISDEQALVVENNEELKNKVMIIDHHASKLYLNKYSFIHVVDEENNRKECATTLFLKYLRSISDEKILYKASLEQFIELIREVDTFDFNEELKESAFKLNMLYNIYGREKYIENYSKFILENDTFYFKNEENFLLELEKERIKRYIEEKLLHVQKTIINGIKVGIVFAEANRSLLGHEMTLRMQDEIDIAVIIDVDRSISYRADKENVDVTLLALPLGGGGHKHAAGSPLPSDLKEKIITYLFKDIK